MEKKRFLFDVYNFDDQSPAIVEEYVPSLPTYSEDELRAALETARAESFRRGKQEGFRESEEGFTQKTYEICQTLGQDINRLLEAEAQRHLLFQQETCTLVHQALEAALPTLMQKGDFEACLALISETLEKYKHDGALTVMVQEDYIEALKNYFEQKCEYQNTNIKFIADSSKGEEGALARTKISWEHGGAVRDPEELKENILKVLEQSLAQKELTSHTTPEQKSEIKDE